jgi:predicted restriction endonuclease
LFARIADNGSALLNEAAATASDEGSLEPFDEAIERSIRDDLTLDETTRNALIAARRGQGQFRRNVETIERVCRITGISDPRLLRASHIRPWRWCRSGSERLDGNNGLLLSPNADHLFDRGFITFEDDGYLVLSPLVDRNDIAKLGIAVSPPPNVGRFSPSQASHLRFHRENVFQQGK